MKNTVLLFGTLIFFLSSCKQPDGKLSGVVAYYFNENYGDKPDVGAKIYIVSSDSAKVDFIKKYEREKSAMKLAESYEGVVDSKTRLIETYSESLTKSYYSKKEKDEYREKISELRKEIDKTPRLDTSSVREYEALGDSAYSQIYTLRDNSKSFIADGAGSFSTNLKPGKYFVLIQSNHRKGKTLADYEGQIDFSSITIESQKETTANAKFTID